MALSLTVVVCCNLVNLLFHVDSRRGALLDLLVVLVVDIHLLLDLALKSVLQGLRVSLFQYFSGVVFFQQKTILSVNVIPKVLRLLSNTINWIECHVDIGITASSTATKLEALKGLPLEEEPVLDLLEGVLSLGIVCGAVGRGVWACGNDQFIPRFIQKC
jgi:hypothetical protein